jgi:hypothetical protein
MLVRCRVSFTFGCAGAAEGDAGRQLRFEQLSMAHLIGARQNASHCRGYSRAILVQANARYELLDVLLGETGIGTSCAGFNTGKTGLDAVAHDLSVARMVRMRAEHVPDGSSGHFQVPYQRFSATDCNIRHHRWFRKIESSIHESDAG